MSLGPGGEDRVSRAGVTAIPLLGANLPKRNENVNPPKKLSINVCSNMVPKSQNVGKIQYVLTVGKGKFKCTVHTVEYCSPRESTETLRSRWPQGKPTIKGQALYNSLLGSDGNFRRRGLV